MTMPVQPEYRRSALAEYLPGVRAQGVVTYSRSCPFACSASNVEVDEVFNIFHGASGEAGPLVVSGFSGQGNEVRYAKGDYSRGPG